MMARSQTLPRFIGPGMCLPALSLLVGHKPAHEERCAAAGNESFCADLGENGGAR